MQKNIFKTMLNNCKSFGKSIGRLKDGLDGKMSKALFDAQTLGASTKNDLFNTLNIIHKEHREEYKLTLPNETWLELHEESVKELKSSYIEAVELLHRCKTSSLEHGRRDIYSQMDKIEMNIRTIYNDIVNDFIHQGKYIHYVMCNNIKIITP